LHLNHLIETNPEQLLHLFFLIQHEVRKNERNFSLEKGNIFIKKWVGVKSKIIEIWKWIF
jgi:hypothetical protein